ncbi:MAG: transcription termination factor NusA [Eubacteriales bacterium]|jgi:N utilization substance protein A
MNTELFDALELLEKEKGIPKQYMLERIEMGLLTALKRDNGGSENISVVMDEKKKEVRIYAKKVVVEEVENDQCEMSLEEAREIDPMYNLGDVVDVEIKPKNFGRITTQNAKQVIIQGIREAERGMVYQEFMSSEHEILTGVVQKVDPRTGNATLLIGKTEMMLVASEQVPGERLTEGATVKVYVVEVRKIAKGPQIMISRTHPGLVKRLFELEVPEIYDGTVEVMSISREAGSRTKIAVCSHDENVDPIGACVGPRGSRVGNIVAELKGEKIDIIKYSEDKAQYIGAALSPANALDVQVDEEEKTCRVTVADDQLSLAIGKEGQNVRLAAKLTGFKIDIKPLSAMQQEEE